MTKEETKMAEPMSNEEMIDTLKGLVFGSFDRTTSKEREALDIAIKALAQQSCEDCISKTEVINAIHKTIYRFFDIADDGSEESINNKDKLLLTINKAISNAVKALPPITPEPFINKPCISEGVCHEDKMQVLDKISAEIAHLTITEGGEDYIRKMAELYSLKIKVLQIIDKYKAESEEEE